MDQNGRDSCYVDLLTVDVQGDLYTCRDLYIDVIIPTDGRHHLMLDLDEYADALADGTMSLQEGIDGLRRWQRFLDRYIHNDRCPQPGWSAFPPPSVPTLLALPALVTYPLRCARYLACTAA